MSNGKTIVIRRTTQGWMAQFLGDREVLAAVGADTIPTAFTGCCPAATVQAEIARLNPGARVVVEYPARGAEEGK